MSEASQFTTLESGLRFQILERGEGGERPTEESEVIVHYTGYLEDGEVFDCSIERGSPARFPLDRVIKGWREGVQLMDVGSKFEFLIPHELGYGAEGSGDVVPPFETLRFVVELIDFQ
jgi:FKBP-type peptidyl-prolyl cis-trans isomerase